MGYRSSNAAYAYDMQSEAYTYGSAAPELQRPQVAERPRLDVLTGAGKKADQAVSPAYVRVLRAVFVVAALFCALGGARVAIASLTAAALNDNASIASELEASASETSDLEVMRSVYGSSTRIRDLAESMLGMGQATDGVTIDVSSADASAANPSQAG